jgi:DNA invertase Pin-like site-specific DNA recombinase
MVVSYIRVSTKEQNTARQENNIKADKYFIEKVSGKSAERKELKAMLDFVRENDIVIVESISRLARNTKDLLNIIDELNKKNVCFVSQKEQIDTRTPQGKFMLTVFGALAELERECILERQREGISVAKDLGKYKGKPKKEINIDEFKKVCRKWRKGEITATKAMETLNLKPNTFYRRVKEYGI